ncbi:hypothetical protein F441_17303 [Phytophthora nicotianae CJ01A1]|uniref:PDZ domain-containing protein n=2 Tax=Phytophthora nicotianae TaxID=4792 RepID=W2MJR9_PHYNI|nr:hypothetical protein L915_16956 [Phytophthora nicotianae]ETM36560.1 hypothetical protein L914_16771 [Phytophthora nicotianae]ETP06272.1 hypothetical protein F441_17303 [Phytophthora nicotianae CJ01A1]
MDVQQLDIEIEKTDKGFGIYFAKVARIDSSVDFLAVDGFVEDPASPLATNQNREALACLQLGDILTKVNGEDCEGKKVEDILALLRNAGRGENTLSFSRSVPIDAPLKDEVCSKTDSEKAFDSVRSVAEVSTGTGNDNAVDSVDLVTEARKSGIMGALLKVKSKIRAEIDGDEDELIREQLEDERFEKQWLEEFDALKKQYEQKWETCTYTADEFCGLLYRSSGAQQKENLQQQYPTIMDAWKDGGVSSSSSRVIPEWPAIKNTYDSVVNYDPVDNSKLVSSSSVANTCSIDCSQSLLSTLECLRVGFMWRADDLQAFSRRLAAAGISSCSGLLEELNAHSNRFERNFQSKEYPRLTKSMLRALHERAQATVAAPSESLLRMRI